ncbi:helix-turn-helix domain-containing protein, partial [Weissella cibaria]|nr:helix-turn-helix domain-containing protein [Weissella cibaria]
ERRMALGLSQRAVAKALGVTPAALSQLENDVTASMQGPRLIKLAKILECSQEWLLSGKESASGGDFVNRYPVITWARLIEVVRQGGPVVSDQSLPCPVPCSENTFALRVDGVSMEPVLSPGDYAYVDL